MLNYRIGNKMSDWGHAMFCSRADDSWCNYAERISSGGTVWVLDSKDCTDIHDLHDLIISEWAADEDKPEYLEDVSGEDIFEQYNPDDIINSAAAWDNDDLVAWFWEHIAEPHDVGAIQLDDGAIAFDEELIGVVAGISEL